MTRRKCKQFFINLDLRKERKKIEDAEFFKEDNGKSNYVDTMEGGKGVKQLMIGGKAANKQLWNPAPVSVTSSGRYSAAAGNSNPQGTIMYPDGGSGRSTRLNDRF